MNATPNDRPDRGGRAGCWMLVRALVVGGLALGSACVLWPTIGPVPEPLERLVPGRISL